MLKDAYSEKFKTIQQEQLEKLKEERREFVKEKNERVKELSKETNRRRKVIEERRQEHLENEEKLRKEVLEKRKQDQQEATQRFQKNTLQKKTLLQHSNRNHAVEKEPIPVLDGLYVVRNHVVEIKDGKQVPHATTGPKQLASQEQAEPKARTDEMPTNYNFHNQYHGPASSEIFYAMSDVRNEGKLYSVHPALDPYRISSSPGQYEGDRLVEKIGRVMENGPGANILSVTEQEKLRADAIARGGPKLAFIGGDMPKDTPEGALPSIMGRESPGGSVTSVDSLDDLPMKEKELSPYPNGIMAKGVRDSAKSATKRKVTFSDSIEFDDGVTGQLVTEEKQSTKVYTMMYSRNASNHCKTPSSSSVSTSAQQKGNNFAGMASMAKTNSEPANIRAGFSSFGNDSTVTTFLHYDQAKPKPVVSNNNRSTEPVKRELSLNQGSLRKEHILGKENVGKVTEEMKESTEVMSDQDLNDSLEFLRDSLDGKHKGETVQQKEDYVKNKAGVTWTIGPEELKDSLKIHPLRTTENTSEELMLHSPPGGSVMDGERHEDKCSKSFGKKEPISLATSPSTLGVMANQGPITSGPVFNQSSQSSATSAVVSVPHFDHPNANAYGTFHQNFPYPFYTSVGDKLLTMHPNGQREQELDSPPLQFAPQLSGPGNPRDEKRLTNSQREPSKITMSSQPADEHYSSNTKGVQIIGQVESQRVPGETGRETKKAILSRQTHSASPSSTVSTASNTQSRSLIPRPPLTKKTGRGRVHPGSFHKKQITAHPRMGAHNNAASAVSSKSPKDSKVMTNNQMKGAMNGQTSSPPQTRVGWNGKIRPKRPDSGDQEIEDPDGILEGIKRNMEMMNMRARDTAAEEQHRRIINSLRLEFGDSNDHLSAQHGSSTFGGTHREDEIVENHRTNDETVSRRVHHPRVGSAGSRVGRSPAEGIVRVVAGGEESFQKAVSHQGRSATNSMRVNDDSPHLSGSRQGRHPALAVNAGVTAHGIDSQMAGTHAGTPVDYYTGTELLKHPAHQLSASQGGRHENTSGAGIVATGYHQVGFRGYPDADGSTDQVGQISQILPRAPGKNQRFFDDKRGQEYPTSTVGHSTSAAFTRQQREDFLQASGMTPDVRENVELNKSISLDKTPTDDEINHLWAHVRSYLHGGGTKSVGSDSCVNRVDVRRSRTRSSSMQHASHQHINPPQNVPPAYGSHLHGTPAQGIGSNLGGLRRYGSHEVLRRDSSSDSLLMKRSSLLQHRASRSRRLQTHAHGQNGRPPLPRQHDHNPMPSQTGPSASIATKVAGSQSLSPAEMQAVMKASEQEMLHNPQNNYFETSPHPQYHGMMAGRKGPSAISLEEQRLMQSLDRLNERLRAQEEITKAISQKPRMNEAGGRKRGQGGSGTRQAKRNSHTTNRNFLHTR